jgi:hypothetical protein
MDSLRELVKRLEPGHYLAWQAEHAKDVEKTRPKTVQHVETNGDVIHVEATGQGEASYHFTVDGTGTSEAYYHPPSKDDPKSLGALVFAELTDTQALVNVRRGWYDSRGKTN